jgi:V/A-type H+-transporting ATPase subunit I
VGRANIGALITAPPVAAGKILLFSGLVLTFLFNNPDKKMIGRLGLGLWEMYNFISALMSDILSYLRLFALGLASGLLGNAFNDIAFMLITREGQIHYASPLIVFTILILVFGHTVNFGLSALGSFVHPLRLTFVEFYKNIGFKGGSSAYKPFFKIEKNNVLNY